MTGAAALNSRTFDEVRADKSAIIGALVVVVLAGLATGLGLGVRIVGLPVYLAGWGFSWATWVLLVYLLAVTIFRPGPATEPRPEDAAAEPEPGMLIRAAGFAQSPALFQVFGVIPGLGITGYNLVFGVATLWQFAAMTVAVRQALGYRSTLRAALVVAAAFVPSLMLELALS